MFRSGNDNENADEAPRRESPRSIVEVKGASQSRRRGSRTTVGRVADERIGRYR